MDDFSLFFQDNVLLIIGFIVVLGLIIWVEYGRFTRKFKQVDTTSAVRLMNQDGTIVLDVREQKEISNGRIQGARHIALGQLATRINELSKFKSQPVLVYCQTGNRSSMACNTLTKNGFEQVHNLAGGMNAWESANLPISKK